MTANTQQSADIVRTQRLTDRLAKSLKSPKRGNQITYDGLLPGFGIRVTAKGRKSFILNYRFEGRDRRITIGRYPDWTVVAARKRSQELRLLIDTGTDPLAKRETKRAAPTVREMYERYDRDYIPKLSKGTAADYRKKFEKYILPAMGAEKLVDVTFSDCERLHRRVSTHSPYAANRMIAILRRAMNLSISWGWLERNPAKGIEFNPEVPREVFLSFPEISRLLKALKEHPERNSADAIKMMLYTGCRRGEALGARWDQFDSEFRIWTKPAATTKQRRLHRVPVSEPVSKLLEKRKLDATSPFIFPGKEGQPQLRVKRTWASLKRQAEIEHVRLHDLRHTFASIAVSQGQSLPIIGAMLGHTQTQTTARYAHLFDAPLRDATEAIGAVLV